MTLCGPVHRISDTSMFKERIKKPIEHTHVHIYTYKNELNLYCYEYRICILICLINLLLSCVVKGDRTGFMNHKSVIWELLLLFEPRGV